MRVTLPLIRPAVAADAAELAAERTERWRHRLSIPTWVAVQDTSIVGFVQAGAGRDEDRDGDLELMSLYTIADVHGGGLGQLLLEVAIGDAPAYLWVFDGNARATRFYEKNGFAFDGVTRQDMYGAESRMIR